MSIAYDGSDFLGSQVQKESSNTVLGQLTKVFQQLGINEKIVASGRTDKGVHATGQICHVDLPDYWNDLKKLQKTLNSMLPKSINIQTIKHVKDNFHARYDAKSRVYRYIVKKGASNPFEHNFITFKQKFDFKMMQQKIALFQGEHDFAYFMKLGSDSKTTIRNIHKAHAYRYKDMYILHFEANGFLRSQVRLMVGALFDLTEDEILQKLALKHNHKLKPAPSNGLYLAKVKY